MSFNFKARLETGQVAAAHVEASRKEISHVLNQLKLDLSEFLNIELELVIKDELNKLSKEQDIQAGIAYLQFLNPNSRVSSSASTKTGYKNISFRGMYGNSIDLLQIKEGRDVFPLNIKSGVNKSIAADREELVEVIGSILESPKTHAKLKAFVKQENEGF
ncbi:TPA: hypothetical protein ACPJ03_000315 [Vibrio diabolicus]